MHSAALELLDACWFTNAVDGTTAAGVGGRCLGQWEALEGAAYAPGVDTPDVEAGTHALSSRTSHAFSDSHTSAPEEAVLAGHGAGVANLFAAWDEQALLGFPIPGGQRPSENTMARLHVITFCLGINVDPKLDTERIALAVQPSDVATMANRPSACDALYGGAAVIDLLRRRGRGLGGN